MKKTLMIVGLILAVGGAAHAASGTPNVTTKTGIVRTIDSSGNPVLFNQDKAWNVFAIEYQTTPVQVVDERGLAPKQGLISRICLESAPAIPLASDWAQVWDTGVAAGMSAAGTGHRIAPPFMRVSGVQACTDINAKFTSGLGIMQGAATGSSYIYWK